MTNIPPTGDVFTENMQFFDFSSQKCYSLYLDREIYFLKE